MPEPPEEWPVEETPEVPTEAAEEAPTEVRKQRRWWRRDVTRVYIITFFKTEYKRVFGGQYTV